MIGTTEITTPDHHREGQIRTNVLGKAETTSGAAAYSVESNGNEQIEVFDCDQRLIFRFDPLTGAATLNVSRGNLQLNCEQGDIELRAAGAIRTTSRDFEVRAKHNLVMTLVGGIGKCLAQLRFRDSRLSLNAEELGVDVNDVSLQANKCHLETQRCSIRSRTTHLESERHVTQAKVLKENATDHYQEIKNVSQIRAGRMRMLIGGLFQFRSRKALMFSDDDFKIKGDQVHLG